MQRSDERRTLLWMLAAFLGSVALHLAQLPAWITLGVLVCAAWSFAGIAGRAPLPGKRLKAVLVAGLTVGVLAAFHTLNGLAAGTALLALMGAVKLLETRTRRDRYIVIAVAMCLLLAASLASQELMQAPLYLAQTWLCMTALAATAHPRSAARTRQLTLLSARSLLFALPLAVAMFLLFPRLSGGFWSIDNTRASTGLSDTMSPGSISDLGKDSTPVFRVWFQGSLPPQRERYWRGPVLHDFDGYTWRRSPGLMIPAEKLDYSGSTYHYRVRLEPDGGLWWPALDTIQSTDTEGAAITADRQLLARHLPHDPVTYNATSHTLTHSSDPLSLQVQNMDTAPMPRGRNPRSVQLARQLRAQSADTHEFVGRVLDLFHRGGFSYSLTPPLLNQDSVDDFLFNTRRGFCGHYASAFVTLMRAGGVPARVVTGYLGGEWNPMGGYLLIRHSDAHAWAEVWLQGEGWTRVDPTAVVAPERLQRDALDLLPNAGSASERLVHEFDWLNLLQQSWDAADAWWGTEFVGYNFHSQLRLLQNLGFSAQGWQQLGALLSAALALWLLAVTWGFNRLPRTSPHRLAQAYAVLCARLAAAGFARQPDQGPVAFARTLEGAPPALAHAGRRLLERYTRLRYGAGTPTETELLEFERDVRALRVARRSARG